MKSIKEFISQQERVSTRWSQEFQAAGYFSAQMTGNGIGDGVEKWQEAHSWCCEQFGEEHYSWTGSQFWFEKEEHAILFALKWG